MARTRGRSLTLCVATGFLIAGIGFAADAKLSFVPAGERAAFDNINCAAPLVGNGCLTLTCVSGCNVAIPDGDDVALGLELTQQDLTNNGFSSCTVHRANVAVELTHQHVGDLLMYFQHDVTGAFIYDPPIACNATSVDAVFADQQAPGAANSCPATGGTRYQSDEPLSAFAGQSLVGTWALGISDTAAGNTGMLNKWRNAFDVTCTPLQQQPLCVPGPTVLCLGAGNRFKVEATWKDHQGNTGQGQVVELTADTGYMWFFKNTNVEMVVKVLNACGTPSNRYWVFAGGLTDVEVFLKVTDTETQAQVFRTYFNPSRTPFEPIQDTNAFATCP